jgi:outer membrane protein insertion porin family
LNLGAGFSSLENFIFDFSIRERNLAGKGQDLRLGLRLSGTRQEIDLGFTEPYFLGRNVAAGFDIFARRVDSTSYGSIFDTKSIGFSLRAGMALNEYWTLSTRYTLRQDDVTIPSSIIEAQFNNVVASLEAQRTSATPDEEQDILQTYDFNGDGVITASDFAADGASAPTNDEMIAASYSRAFQESIGKRYQSIVGYSAGFNTLNAIIRPTRGHSFYFHQDFAGLGGSVRYLRNRINFDNYWTPWQGWTFRIGGEAGYITGLGQDLRLNDKFFIGGPRMRGFDTSGIGPRDFNSGSNSSTGSLGGTAFYIGRAELFFPLGDMALESGINASIFADVGSLFWAKEPDLTECTFSLSEWEAFQADTSIDFDHSTDCLAGNSVSPRIAIGVGFSWQSPFGPFRIDLTKALKKQLGDRPQTLQFNVGTAF